MQEIIAGLGGALFQVIWLALVLAFAFLEAITSALVAIWFMGGALAALLVSFLNPPLWLQIATFLSVSILLLISTKPIVEKKLNVGKIKTNSEALIGKQARVTETIDNIKSTGAVYVDGKTWTARNTVDTIVIEPDKMVEIVKIEGVKLIVDCK